MRGLKFILTCGWGFPPGDGVMAEFFLLVFLVCELASMCVPRIGLSGRTGEVRERGGKAATLK